MDGREVDGMGVEGREVDGMGVEGRDTDGMGGEGREVDGMGMEEGEWREGKWVRIGGVIGEALGKGKT